MTNKHNLWTTISCTVSLGLGLAVCLTPRGSSAASSEYCAPTTEMSPFQLLRQASLDLRGRVPSFEEYELVQSADDPQAAAEDLIDDLYESEEYLDEIREQHRALLWGTVDRVTFPSLTPSRRALRPDGSGNWRVSAMQSTYRGADVSCLNQLHSEFDEQGRPIPDADGRDGYVMVNPYWAPDTQIPVCAFDAMDVESGSSGSCSTYHGTDPGCGCGSDLRWCAPDESRTENDVIREALAEEPARVFQYIVENNRPYLEAFTTRTTMMNGPVAHYYRHNSGTDTVTRGAMIYEPAVDVPELGYDLDTWVPVERGQAHAGAFTTLAYLLRFGTNRARADRFYTAFFCDPFVPPEEGLPAEEQNPSPNLRERSGCGDCHEALEPAAAHWARWRTSGTYGWFAPEEFSFEAPRDDCVCGGELGTCSGFCNSYFVTADNSSPEEFAEFAGMPLAGSWLEGDEPANIEAGPGALVDGQPERDKIAQCAVRTLGERLLGREMTADDLTWLEEQTEAFADSEYDYTAMVRRMIEDERYRTIR